MFDLRMEHIDIAHRLSNQGKGKREIIVKFVSRNVKYAVMKNRKLLKCSDIFVNDDLTRMNVYVLMCLRKKLKRRSERGPGSRRKYHVQEPCWSWSICKIWKLWTFDKATIIKLYFYTILMPFEQRFTPTAYFFFYHFNCSASAQNYIRT